MEKQVFDLNHKLWSAKLLYEHPLAIVKAHITYLRGGVRFITNSTYQALIQGLINKGFNTTQAKLILKSLTLARETVETNKSETNTNSDQLY